MLEVGVVLLDLVCEDGRGRDEAHPQVLGLVHVLVGEFWHGALGLHDLLLWSSVSSHLKDELLLFIKCQIGDFLTEKAEDGGGGLTSTRASQDE